MLARTLFTRLGIVLALAVPAAQAQENLIVPGADWVGVGVDLLGFHLDANGYPKKNEGERKLNWILKGIEQGGEGTAYVDHQIGDQVYRVPKILDAKADYFKRTRTYTSTNTHELHSTTKSEYSLEASYDLFSGKFEHESEVKTDHSETRYYAWSTDVKKTHIIFVRNVDLKGHLNEQFKAKLEDPKVSPDALFLEYGTHLVQKVAIGSRKEMFTSKLDTEDVTESEFKTSVEAGFEGFVSGQAKFSGSNKEKEVFSEASTNEATHGDENSPAVIGFLKDSKSLLGIWELCSDPERKQQLEQAYQLRSAIKAITTPVIFSAGPGNLAAAPGTNAELKVTVPEHYKILSGGGRATPASPGGFFLCDSYPEDARTWKVRARTARDGGGQLTVSVVAIFDPDNHWVVRVDQADRGNGGRPLSGSEINAMVNRTGFGAYGGVFSGGGARVVLKTKGSNPMLWMHQNLPLIQGYIDSAGGLDDRRRKLQLKRMSGDHDGVARLLDRGDIRPAGANNPYTHEGWVVGHTMPHGSTQCDLQCFVISASPRTAAAKRVALELRVYVEKSSQSSAEPRAQVMPKFERGPQFHLIGGGAFAPGKYQYINASYPARAQDGRHEWRVRTANVHVKDAQHTYALAVAIRAKRK